MFSRRLSGVFSWLGGRCSSLGICAGLRAYARQRSEPSQRNFSGADHVQTPLKVFSRGRLNTRPSRLNTPPEPAKHPPDSSEGVPPPLKVFSQAG